MCEIQVKTALPHQKRSQKAVSRTHSQMTILLYCSADQAHSEFSHTNIAPHRIEDTCKNTTHDSSELCCTVCQSCRESQCRMMSCFLKQFPSEGQLLFY